MGKRMRWFSIIRNINLCNIRPMLIVIFTYNRPDMLRALVSELEGKGHDLIIIDDGSKWSDPGSFIDHSFLKDHTFIRTEHTGKKGFWKKWQLAFETLKQFSLHEWVCFMPDDVSQVNLSAIEMFTKQGWGNMRVAINLSNSGTRYRWGKYSSGQPDIEIEGMLLQECGWVDGLFITNRYTLEGIQMDEVPESWFNRPDKSSGVGYQLTKKLQAKRVKMMLPEFSYCYHGDHESVMHPEHRKEVPLISKMKP